MTTAAPKEPTTTAVNTPTAGENTELATRDAATPARQEPARGVPVRMGIAPASLEEAWRMAQMFANSEMVPKQFRSKPHDVLVAIQYGMELGFPPMQALQSIAVINGRPSVWGDGFLALIMASTAYREHDEYFLVKGERRELLVAEDLKDDNTTAVSIFWRRDKANPVYGYFSIAQAKKSQLLGKDGPWQTYPDRMLKLRARGFAGRDAFPDVLRGVKSAEELIDGPVDDLPALPERPAPVQPRRASEARTESPSPALVTPASTRAVSAPATSPTSSAPSTDDADQVVRGLKVTHTGFVKPATGEPYYAVKMVSTTGKEVQFSTRVEPIYREAASFEGTDHMVVASYHHDTEAGKRVNVLDGIAIYEGAAPAAHSGELFD